MTDTAISRARALTAEEETAFAALSGRFGSALDRLLDMIVPASAVRNLPSARDVGVLDYLRVLVPEALTEVAAGFVKLEQQTQERHRTTFDRLSIAAQQALIDELRAADRNFMQRLALEAVSCYYQHPQVLAALAIEDRPPFPKGYQVIAGDLTLLEPVRRRGQVYRDV